MRKSELKKLKQILLDMRQSIVMGDKTSSIDDESLESSEMPDESDKACTEASQKIAIRIMDRDRNLLRKVEKALDKFEDGSFGMCERCEEEISVQRLKVRPVTTLCIDCKEDEEKLEKVYQKDVIEEQ